MINKDIKIDIKTILYIFLFNIYLKKDTNEELKTSIINLLNILRVNIETGKEIYEYLFQNLSKLYRGEEELKPNRMKNYLFLLYILTLLKLLKILLICL